MVTVPVLDTPRTIIAEAVLAIVAALVGGASLRQYRDRAAQAEALLSERVRADAERDRAAALAERNASGGRSTTCSRTRSAPCPLQLEAADALLESGADLAAVRPLVHQARRFAVEALAETNAAVHAQRNDPVALSEQLTALATADGAGRTITGTSRPLPPDITLALYAQLGGNRTAIAPADSETPIA
jgi:hypothetical protein